MRPFAMLVFALMIFAEAPLAHAAAPTRLPIQGYLTDADDLPIDDTVNLTVKLYADQTGGAALYAEQVEVAVQEGFFTAFIGGVTTLDLSLFATHSTMYVGLAVGTDAEMSPRLAIATTPYAAYAEYAGTATSLQGSEPADFAPAGAGVPTGAVMPFDLASCPPGWSELPAARGRALVGLPAGGTLGGTVGAPLANLENRAHTHSVDPAAAATTSAGDHLHTVDPISATTSSAGTHSHSIAAVTVTSGSGGTHTHTTAIPDHNHEWARLVFMGGDDYEARTFAADGTTNLDMIYWGDGVGADGAGIYPLAFDPAPSTGTSSPGPYFTKDTSLGTITSSSNGSHSHTVDIGATSTGSTGAHTHTLDVAETASSSAGAHAHDVDVALTVSSAGTTADVMPYLQLLMCRKD